MKHILCFGDSNLFGRNPSGGRWPLEQRWTGILSKALGEGYHLIEEGLGGRTTVFDNPFEANKCGLKQLPIMLHSHRPLDLVILSLGSNDCQTQFNANAKIIAKGLEKLALMIKDYPYGEQYPIPQVLVISPIHIGEGVEAHFATLDHSSHLLSKALGPAIREMAKKNDLLFLDASLVAKSSPIDLLHMDREAHASLAAAILPLVLTWFDDERAQGIEEDMNSTPDNEEEGNALIIDEGKEEKLGVLESKEEAASSSSKRGRLPLSLRFFKKRF